ncbi:MAG: CARDB domain-containing protein [bacterium]
MFTYLCGAGKTISFSDTIKNQGGSDVGSSTSKFYLSTNRTLEATVIYLGQRTVPALTAGTSNTVSTSLTVPAGTATRAYYLIAKTDGDNSVSETNEANNITTGTLVTIGPDIYSLTMSAPNTAKLGESITVSDTTTNNGGGDAKISSKTYFYLSANKTWETTDIYLGQRSIPALAAGVNNTDSIVLTIPTGIVAGNYYLMVKVDGDNNVYETKEGNNINYKSITIDILGTSVLGR